MWITPGGHLPQPHHLRAPLRGPPQATGKNYAAVERSLERYPWATLADNRGARTALQVFGEDGQAWVVTTTAHRLPGPFAADLWVVLAHRFNQAGRPASGEVSLPVRQILRTMYRGQPGGRVDSIATAVTLLNAVRIVAVGTWRKRDSLTFTLGEATLRGTELTYTFAPAIQAAFAAGEYRLLDIDTYFRLRTPTARRLYRYLDYRRWKGAEQQSTVTIGLTRLAAELPIQRTRPSHILRTLAPAHAELVQFGVLSLAQVTTLTHSGPKDAEARIRYAFADAVPVSAPAERIVRTAASTDYLAELVDQCVTTLKDPHSLSFYVKVCKTLPPDTVRNILGGVQEMLQGSQPLTMEAARKVFTSTARSRARHMQLTL